ncbi:MAG TPA: BON domain-containing protein [Solirubrobacteraceae bacterium]|nr:BON domain-containing protein [Solirubrobacteraceae bacterium]
MTLISRRRRSNARRAMGAALLFAGGAAAGALARSLDARRRHMARDRGASLLRRGAAETRRRGQYRSGIVKGAAHRIASLRGREAREYDDVTLARKVESELFRSRDVPKGHINVNVQYGIVELRGQVERPEQIEELGAAARRVEGVRELHNLLHTPGSPPQHSPPSDPADVRARAAHTRP